MDKRQFLAGAALLAAQPALAQAAKPGTDELGRTLASMKEKPLPHWSLAPYARTTRRADAGCTAKPPLPLPTALLGELT